MDGNTVHFIAGATGGTAGAVVTCPLEVLKTRLQSSNKSLLTDRRLHFQEIPLKIEHFRSPLISSSPRIRLGEMYSKFVITAAGPSGALAPDGLGYATTMYKPGLGIVSALRNIISTEGPGALFKGLLPNLVGVAPSRAVYFAAYAHGKNELNCSGLFSPDTPIVHILAAGFAGFSSATCTNPIWVVKTRMQLNPNKISTFQCARTIYTQGGFKSFYKGVTASYYGLGETIIHLVIYEEIKRFIASNRAPSDFVVGDSEEEPMRKDLQRADMKSVSVVRWFMEFMGAGAISKTIATCVAYPHEVARTRLREENTKHRKFWQTLIQVYKDEGVRGLYRGLGVQLVRQIPNTAIVMATYEAMVHLLSDDQTSRGSDQDYE